MKTRILGINCTAAGVFIAVTTGSGDNFKVVSTDKLTFSVETAEGIRALHRTLRTVLAGAITDGAYRFAILKCFSGPRGSSVEAIKAEAIMELVAVSELALDLKRVAPHGFPKVLNCDPGQKWQQRAKQRFNPDGEIKHWSGTDGAVCAAYKAAAL